MTRRLLVAYSMAVAGVVLVGVALWLLGGLPLLILLTGILSGVAGTFLIDVDSKAPRRVRK